MHQAPRPVRPRRARHRRRLPRRHRPRDRAAARCDGRRGGGGGHQRPGARARGRAWRGTASGRSASSRT
nr:hypothetical protein [Angustibacter aerolatus]